jgi:hypothetical protein
MEGLRESCVEGRVGEGGGGEECRLGDCSKPLALRGGDCGGVEVGGGGEQVERQEAGLVLLGLRLTGRK